MRPTNQEMDKHKITFTTIYMSKLNRMTSITIIMRELAIEIWVVVAIFVKPQHAVVTSILNCDQQHHKYDMLSRRTIEMYLDVL